MLEPSDLRNAVDRLLVGFGLLVSSAAYLLVVAFVAAGSGHHIACYLAITSLGFCGLGYMSQIVAADRGLALWLIGGSWMFGVLAGLILLA